MVDLPFPQSVRKKNIKFSLYGLRVVSTNGETKNLFQM